MFGKIIKIKKVFENFRQVLSYCTLRSPYHGYNTTELCERS